MLLSQLLYQSAFNHIDGLHNRPGNAWEIADDVNAWRHPQVPAEAVIPKPAQSDYINLR